MHLPGRRTWLGNVGLAGLALRSPLAAEVPATAANVKVTGPKIFRVKVNRCGNWTIARLQTNAGVTGIGGASQSGNGRETPQFLTEFSEILKDRSVFDVEWFRSRVAPVIADHQARSSVAASALEQCLWDIRGVKENRRLGEGAGQLIAPHGPASPVGNVAAAHVRVTLPNSHMLEFSYGEVPWRLS